MLGIATIGAGCGSSSHVAVDAKSDGLSTYQSAIGHLNTSGYDVGDIVEVDLQNDKVFKSAQVQVSPKDLAFSKPASQFKEHFAGVLDFTYDGKCSEGLKQKISDDVRDKTIFHVDGAWTRSLKDPATFIIGSEPLAQRLSKLQAEHPADQFFLVCAVTAADKIYLSADNAKDNTLHSAGHDFQLRYAQNGALAKLARDKESFFQLTPLKLDAADGRTVVLIDSDVPDALPPFRPGSAVAAASW